MSGTGFCDCSEQRAKVRMLEAKISQLTKELTSILKYLNESLSHVEK